MLPCKRPGLNFPWRSHQQISLSPGTAKPIQASVLPRLVNEYQWQTSEWYDRWLSIYNPGSVGCTRVHLFYGTLVLVCTVSWGQFSIAASLLCYHAGDPDLIPCECHISSSLYLLTLLGKLSLTSFRGWYMSTKWFMWFLVIRRVFAVKNYFKLNAVRKL